jgi:hypothetical protein
MKFLPVMKRRARTSCAHVAGTNRYWTTRRLLNLLQFPSPRMRLAGQRYRPRVPFKSFIKAQAAPSCLRSRGFSFQASWSLVSSSCTSSCWSRCDRRLQMVCQGSNQSPLEHRRTATKRASYVRQIEQENDMTFASRSQSTPAHFIGVLRGAFGLVFTFLLVSTQPTLGQNGPVSKPASVLMNSEQRQSDALFANYKFRDGETLPTLRVHYVTLGHPHKNETGTIDNAVLVLHWTNASGNALLTPEYQRALFAPGSPIDATRFYVIIPPRRE